MLKNNKTIITESVNHKCIFSAENTELIDLLKFIIKSSIVLYFIIVDKVDINKFIFSEKS